MRLLTLTGDETWGQMALAVRHLRHTQRHVGERSILGLRIEDEIRSLKQCIAVLTATGGE
jgi:hypothetical protein